MKAAIAMVIFGVLWFYLAKYTNFVTDLRAPKCVCTCEERK